MNADLYDIPTWITDKINNEQFLHKFIQNISLEFQDKCITLYDMNSMESTDGWKRAFNNTCEHFSIEHIETYVNRLDAFDFDEFCFEVTSILVDNKIIGDG